MIDKIKQIIASIDDEALYLVEKFSNKAGFFATKNNVCFLIINNEKLAMKSIKTEFLELNTNIFIQSVANDSNFPSEYYNSIFYTGSLDNDLLNSFILLCKTYVADSCSFTFENFFFSLISLFQLPKEQAYKNLLGMFGEIKFIEAVYSRYKIDISSYWHTNGEYSKYDFVFQDKNIEIKSILSEDLTVLLKHSQVFNSDNNYIGIMCLEKNNSGESLDELLKKINKVSVFSQNIGFQIKLLKEKARVPKRETEETKLKLLRINIYKVSDLNTIMEIPNNILNITYDYNFSYSKPLSINKSFFK